MTDVLAIQAQLTAALRAAGLTRASSVWDPRSGELVFLVQHRGEQMRHVIPADRLAAADSLIEPILDWAAGLSASGR